MLRKLNGKTKHIPQAAAADLLHLQPHAYEYLGHYQGEELIGERPDVVFWNGNNPGQWDGGRFIANMHIPGEVIS